MAERTYAPDELDLNPVVRKFLAVPHADHYLGGSGVNAPPGVTAARPRGAHSPGQR